VRDERLVGFDHALVGGDDHTFRRVDRLRQLLERHLADPFVLVGPAGRRELAMGLRGTHGQQAAG
jgi:hypothetical protein